MHGSFIRFAALYAALFAGFGVVSPFLPAFLQGRGLGPEAIGLVLGLGSAVRLVSGPAGGRLADRTGAARAILAALLGASAVVALGYVPAHGLLPLAAVGVLHAAVLAPLTPLGDALAVRAAAGNAAGAGGFEYGWLRGIGSGAFIVGSIGSGMLAGWYGLGVAIWLNALLLAVAALCALRVPAAPVAAGNGAEAGAWRALLRVPGFAPLMGVVALVGASHALHDGFGVIRWRASGMSDGAAGALWAESVAAEVLVFFVLGRPLLDRLGPGGAALLCAAAGVLRWGVTAGTAAAPAMALVEPLHGFTFALLHLSAMRVIAERVPPGLTATAQAFYGNIALGAAGTAMTFASGPLFASFGPRAFWAMAALCVLAMPLAARLSRPAPAGMPGMDRGSADR